MRESGSAPPLPVPQCHCQWQLQLSVVSLAVDDHAGWHVSASGGWASPVPRPAGDLGRAPAAAARPWAANASGTGSGTQADTHCSGRPSMRLAASGSEHHWHWHSGCQWQCHLYGSRSGYYCYEYCAATDSPADSRYRSQAAMPMAPVARFNRHT